MNGDNQNSGDTDNRADISGESKIEIVMGTDADVTSEDLANLGDKDRDMDGGDDELLPEEGLDDTDAEGDPLNEAATDLDSTGADLDLPGTQDTDPGLEGNAPGDDEENDYYSLPDQGDNNNEA